MGTPCANRCECECVIQPLVVSICMSADAGVPLIIFQTKEHELKIRRWNF